MSGLETWTLKWIATKIVVKKLLNKKEDYRGWLCSEEQNPLLEQEDPGSTPAEDQSFFRLAHEKLISHLAQLLINTNLRKNKDRAIYRRKMLISLWKRVVQAQPE